MKVIVYDDYNSKIRKDKHTIGTLTTNCGGGLRKWFKIIELRRKNENRN